MRINLIPMAGEGQRFVNAGYTTPKPLLDINGLPMVVSAAKSLPPADKYIFVCRRQHLETSPIEEVLKRYFNNVEIVIADQLTEGQAISCMLAKDHIPDDATLTIGASDNDMTYDQQMVESLFNDPDTDGWIWTFRHNPAVLQNPAMYGWVVSNDTSLTAQKVSCKIPISDTPINDHAVIGAFTFKRADIFFDAVAAMVKADERINNEFYVDVAMDFAIRNGNKIKVCEVDKYICWGTPKDYEEYEYWLRYFQKRLLP